MASPPSPNEIFEAHVGFVWRVLRHLGVPDADLDDLCQEVFVVLFSRFGAIRPGTSMQTWLYSICWRLVRNHGRLARVRREDTVAEPPDAGHPPDQEDAAAAAQRAQRLRQLLDRLDDEKRAVVVLYELEDMPMKEVARTLGCPLQTAYSRLHAARAELLAAYQEGER